MKFAIVQENIIAVLADNLVRNHDAFLGHPSPALAGLNRWPGPWVTASIPHKLPEDQDRRARRWHCRHFCSCESIIVHNRIFYSRYSQQAISNASVSDFLIVEYNSEIGGRVRHTEFGKDPDGNPYTVELGANWVGSTLSSYSTYRAPQRTEVNQLQVQGTVIDGGPENPIWTFVTSSTRNSWQLLTSSNDVLFRPRSTTSKTPFQICQLSKASPRKGARIT